MTITTSQIRGARGILDWSQADLADRTGISATSIGSIENGQSTPRANTLQLIRKAFEDGGIEFIGRDGVRQKAGDIRTFRGREGFWDFYEDIFQTVARNPGEILVSNVDEREFLKWLGEERAELHIARMKKLEDIKYYILTQEGDTFFKASQSYAEYRWVKKEFFASVPFYVYGKKLAIMLFTTQPVVIVLDYSAVAEAYRSQFHAMWELAIVPPDEEHKQAHG